MRDRYDVIIIGAGIGGLVCGCYLAKAGMKVLIIEQDSKPGGYCTSFRRQNYKFDVGVHYLGAGRKRGELGKLIKELSLEKKLRFKRIDPCDKVITPNATFRIRANSSETIQEIINAFRKDKQSIIEFFNFVTTKNFYHLYAICKAITFKDLLDRYFQNEKLKSALSILLGNIGLPPSKVAAISAAALYREFILDPGYYPEGGMQYFANALALTFKEYGGTLKLNSKVKAILTKKSAVEYVMNEKKDLYKAHYVVSNIDAKSTFANLLDIKNKFVNDRINSLEPTFSAFAVYIGISKYLANLSDKCSIWYFTTNDIEKCYGAPMQNLLSTPIDYTVCLFPSFHDIAIKETGKVSLTLFSAASYMTKNFWDTNRQNFAKKMINKVEEIIPNLSRYVEVLETATPHTFSRYTANQQGALYGWACTPNQIKEDTFPQETVVKNLFLVGHWCTNGVGQGGISEVIYSGKRASNLILRDLAKIKIDTCHIERKA